jgi:hypothetical protein
MKQEDINLIPKFMGYKTLNNEYYYLLPLDLPQFRGSDHGEWCSQHRVSFTESYWEINEESLQYNTSWDWLMPVSQKIDKYLFDNIDKVGYFDECLNSNDIEIRYQAVIEFIKWYNKYNAHT